jgi:AcrR family transcriptional regulator
MDRRTRAARAEGRDGRSALLDAAGRVFAERGYKEASVDAIAAEAGFSKGAVYWHFTGKEDLFFALLEERIDRPLSESIRLLEEAPPERDMAPEASRWFVDLLQGQSDLVLLENDYRSLAMRDDGLRKRYAQRRAMLRRSLAGALETRVRRLGAPEFDIPAEQVATAFMALASGLALEAMVDPDAVGDDLLGETMALVYAGLVMRATGGPDAGAGLIPRSP